MFLSSTLNDSHSKDGVVFHSTKALCRELIDRLHWPSQLFAPEHDRCFCRDCYPLAMPNVRQATTEHACPVIVPRNWLKFGLKVDDVHASVHQVWVKRDGRERERSKPISSLDRTNGLFHTTVRYPVLLCPWSSIDRFVCPAIDCSTALACPFGSDTFHSRQTTNDLFI